MIAIDIETVAGDMSIMESIMPEFEGRTGTKDPDKIAAQIAVKKAEWVSKAALDPNLGRIACICLHNDKDSYSLTMDGNEPAMLLAFWTIMVDEPSIVTFNGKMFDMPYIIRRSWYCGVPPSITYDSAPYHSVTHFDLRLILSNGDKRAAGKLSQYAKLKLGVDMDTKGSEVQALWDAGKIDEIVKHCEEDARITWELFQSMQGFYF